MSNHTNWRTNMSRATIRSCFNFDRTALPYSTTANPIGSVSIDTHASSSVA